MAAFDNFRDMNDVALKPRLLRSLLEDKVPDEKHPFRSPSELLQVVSEIKIHGLLSESYPESTDIKHVQHWESSVDAWIDRLLVLVSSNMPDKCWAGISLIGVTCEECSSVRFLASYSTWFHKLLSHIQPPADSHFVKLAACTSLSDLFTRLGGFSNVKKDGISHAGKLIQPLLKLLNEDSSEAVWEGATILLCTILAFFPSSVHRHYDAVEAAIVSKIKSEKCSESTLKKLAHCLALLPKSKGDEDSWSLMMQKILLSINVHLNHAFQGLEEESKCNEAIRLLAPPGKDPPPPLGGHTTSGEALDNTTHKSERFPVSSVSTLMLCCCKMLTSSYPVQVAVPAYPLLALVRRVLMVNGSLSQALFPFTTAMRQQFICSHLPVLHTYSLDLLTAIIKGMRREYGLSHYTHVAIVFCSQLLPHAAEIMRLLTEYFRRCVSPELRIKVYSIVKIVLISMGVGIAVYLAPEVIKNASLDLDSIDYESNDTSKASAEALLQPSHRKRKHGSAAGSHEEQHDIIGMEMGGRNRNPTTLTSVRIAALEALEVLLTVGGASKSECWQSNVDSLLISVATNACKGGWANEETNIFLPNDHTSTWADFQLASLRALLASLLSRARVRSPYLAQGLELFRRGKQETGTTLAEFCAHAMLALEVLIHPRARSLSDFPSANNNAFDEINYRAKKLNTGGQNHNFPFSNGMLGMGPSNPDLDEDDLYRSWLKIDDEIEVPVTDPGTNNIVGESSKSVKDPSAEKLLSLNGSSKTKDSEVSMQGLAAADANVRMGKNIDEIMVETTQLPEPISREGVMIPATVGGSTDGGAAPESVVSGNGVSDPMESEMASDKGILATEGDEFAAIDEKDSTTIANFEKFKVLELDHESSMDDYPDIIDGDPDSD